MVTDTKLSRGIFQGAATGAAIGAITHAIKSSPEHGTVQTDKGTREQKGAQAAAQEDNPFTPKGRVLGQTAGGDGAPLDLDEASQGELKEAVLSQFGGAARRARYYGESTKGLYASSYESDNVAGFIYQDGDKIRLGDVGIQFSEGEKGEGYFNWGGNPYETDSIGLVIAARIQASPDYIQRNISYFNNISDRIGAPVYVGYSNVGFRYPRSIYKVENNQLSIFINRD